ncbi:MAG: 50S ribosomal protein L9 [bacterium]|nr:50S ribosomal protein L9 [bacterium]
MKIILRQDHEKLGRTGTTVEVKDGYARNYLLPRGLVYPATPKFERMLAQEDRLNRKRESHKQRNAQDEADVLTKASVVAKAKVGEEGRLFGSVTAQDIVDLLAQQGIELDRRKIVMEEPIKFLGTYQVRIHLHGDVNAHLQVSVVKDEE